MSYPECLQPYEWYEAHERIPNDYRTKDDKPTEYPAPAMSTPELLEFIHEKEQDSLNDLIPW